MKARQLKLSNGETLTINDNEWVSVVNLKEFDDKDTEIVRITRHQNGMMSRIYVMRSAGGNVTEHNEIVISDNPRTAATAAMTKLGLTRISPSSL